MHAAAAVVDTEAVADVIEEDKVHGSTVPTREQWVKGVFDRHSSAFLLPAPLCVLVIPLCP